MEKGIEVQRVGQVDVDSGNVVLGDPCYVVEHSYEHLTGLDEVEMKEGKGWFIKGTDIPAPDRGLVTSIPYGKGKAMVVVARSGFGDGSYPVFAMFQKTQFGRRCMGLFVDFGEFVDGQDAEEFLMKVVENAISKK